MPMRLIFLAVIASTIGGLDDQCLCRRRGAMASDETDKRHRSRLAARRRWPGARPTTCPHPGGTDGARAWRIAGTCLRRVLGGARRRRVPRPLAGRHIDLFGGRDVLPCRAWSLLRVSRRSARAGRGLLFAGWLVIGIGMAMGLYEAAFSTLAGIYGRKGAWPITGITLLAGLASTICWPISAYLEAEVGWRMACLVLGSAHILIGLPLNRFLVPLGTQPVPSATNEAAPGSW